MGGSGGMVPRPELPRADSMAAAGPPDGSRASRGMVPRVALGALTFLFPFAVLLAVWAAVKGGFGLPDNTLASPMQALRALGAVVQSGVLPAYVSASLARLTVGCLLAVAIGLPVGILLGLTRYGARMFEPFLRFFQAVSGIAWLPMAIIWFGFTNATVFVVIVYTALIPIVFSTMTGVRTVPPILSQAVATMGGGRGRVIRDVYLPGALPSIVVGCRLGVGYGWRALIAGEMLTGKAGLGFLIFDARRFDRIDRIIAGMLVIGTLYLIIDRLLLAPVEEATAQRWGSVR